MAGDLVLITGVSGHIGFRVLAAALNAGYRVRAIVRKPEQIYTIKTAKSIRSFSDTLEMAVVPDILKDGAFDDVLNGVKYVIHVASPMGRETQDPERDIIQPAIKGTLNILVGAHKVPTIKRVVITSSAAVIVGGRPEDKTRVFSEADVIPRPVPPYRPELQPYAISKALAFYKTFDWMEENNPSFDVINIHPTLVIGRNELNTTVKEMNVGSNTVALNPLLGIQAHRKMVFGCVHIDDVATAHIKSLDPTVKGNQSFLLALPKLRGQWDNVIEISKKLFPGIENKFPMNGSTPSKTMFYDSSKAERELGIVFKPLEEQLRSLVAHLIELKDAE